MNALPRRLLRSTIALVVALLLLPASNAIGQADSLRHGGVQPATSQLDTTAWPS